MLTSASIETDVHRGSHFVHCICRLGSILIHSQVQTFLLLEKLRQTYAKNSDVVQVPAIGVLHLNSDSHRPACCLDLQLAILDRRFYLGSFSPFHVPVARSFNRVSQKVKETLLHALPGLLLCSHKCTLHACQSTVAHHVSIDLLQHNI